MEHIVELCASRQLELIRHIVDTLLHLRAWREIIRSPSSWPSSLASASSSITSITNNCWHSSLWPLEKSSLQRKHRPSLQRYVISVGVRRRVGMEDLPCTDAVEEARAVMAGCDDGCGGGLVKK
jgi:hypothetical protein